MPKTVSAFFDEMLSSASLSFKLYSELSIGAYNCISHHATDIIKNKYLPKMVEGKWSGTMCLTEPVCGTDLGLLKTKAEEQTDGTFKISGQKIFITSGDHDLTENIIHLVIARTTDAPPGTRGISLFLVPKFIVNEDGSIGSRNGISKYHFACLLAKMANLDQKYIVRVKKKNLKFIAKRNNDMRMDLKKFEKDFKIKLPILKSEIKEIAKFYI